MLRDRHVKLFLALIAALLAANLVVTLRLPVAHAQQETSATKAQDGHFGDHFSGSNKGSALACSADGKIVYAADGEDVFRSLDFGVAGSWEHVLR